MFEPVAFECELSIDRKAIVKEQGSPDTGQWVVEGYASTSDLDSQDHIITEAAIQHGAESLQEYQTLLFNHDPNRPIGRLGEAEARGNKLWIKAYISKSEPLIWEKVKDGTLSKFSVRGRILDAEETVEAATEKKVVTIKDMELFEVSLVSVPANSRARSLAWYIEKARTKIAAALGLNKKSDDVAVDFSAEIEKLKQEHPWLTDYLGSLDKTEVSTGMDIKKNRENLKAAVEALKQLMDNLEGEDKDQVKSIVNALMALDKKVYGGKKEDEEYGYDMANKQIAPAKLDDPKNEPAPVAVPGPSEIKVPQVDTSGLEQIVTQLQELVKGIMDQVELSKGLVSQANESKSHVDKAVEQLIEAIDKLPIRKGLNPIPEGDDRREIASSIKAVEATVGEDRFKKMNPGDRLQAVLEHKLGGR